MSIYRYIAIFATTIQYNTTETGYRYIVNCDIFQYIVKTFITLKFDTKRNRERLHF